MAPLTVSNRRDSLKGMPDSPDQEEKLTLALCDRDRLLLALASRPPLSKEIGDQMLRDIQEAREASIAGSVD